MSARNQTKITWMSVARQHELEQCGALDGPSSKVGRIGRGNANNLAYAVERFPGDRAFGFRAVVRFEFTHDRVEGVALSPLVRPFLCLGAL